MFLHTLTFHSIARPCLRIEVPSSYCRLFPTAVMPSTLVHLLHMNISISIVREVFTCSYNVPLLNFFCFLLCFLWSPSLTLHSSVSLRSSSNLSPSCNGLAPFRNMSKDISEHFPLSPPFFAATALCLLVAAASFSSFVVVVGLCVRCVLTGRSPCVFEKFLRPTHVVLWLRLLTVKTSLFLLFSLW